MSLTHLPSHAKGSKPMATVKCTFCGRTEELETAIDAGWFPSYYDGEEEEIDAAVCDRCAADRLSFENPDRLPELRRDGEADCVRQCLDALQRMADEAEQASQGRRQAAAARIPDAPDWAVTQRHGYREGLAADGIELVPAETVYVGLDDAIEDDDLEPSPAEWDRLAMDARDYPPSGGLD